MLPSGVFVRTDLDDLISSLPGRLTASGPSRLTVEIDPETPVSKEQPFVELSRWSDKWCLIEVSGPDELTALVVECVVSHEPIGEVLPCRFQIGTGEYSYALFRDGRLMESFECRGPSIETVNFTSELRKVPLQNLLRASEFMIESISRLGIEPGSRPVENVRKVRFQVNLPGKRSFWQALLGALSPR